MLRVLTNLNLLNRQDFEAPANVIASGVTGTWVKMETEALAFVGSAGDFAVGPIWTESYRDGSIGKWTPEVATTDQLTLIWGKMRALTDQFSGTPAVGTPLRVRTDGKLEQGTANSDYIVAYCTKASHSIQHLGTSHTVIEFMTV